MDLHIQGGQSDLPTSRLMSAFDDNLIAMYVMADCLAEDQLLAFPLAPSYARSNRYRSTLTQSGGFDHVDNCTPSCVSIFLRSCRRSRGHAARGYTRPKELDEKLGF